MPKQLLDQAVILVRQLSAALPLTRKLNQGIPKIKLQCRVLLDTGS